MYRPMLIFYEETVFRNVGNVITRISKDNIINMSR